jgi:hypothetical protein
LFLVLKIQKTPPPNNPKIKPSAPVMRILRKGLWVESLKRIGEIKPHLNNLTDSLVLGR